MSTQRFQNLVFRPQAGVTQVPAHVQLVAEFPAGHVITLICSWLNGASPGAVLYAHKATLSLDPSGARIDVTPDREFTHDVEAVSLRGFTPQDIRKHEKNWLDCIRSGRRPNGNIDLAIRAQTVLSLAEMSDRLKVTCR